MRRFDCFRGLSSAGLVWTSHDLSERSEHCESLRRLRNAYHHRADGVVCFLTRVIESENENEKMSSILVSKQAANQKFVP